MSSLQLQLVQADPAPPTAPSDDYGLLFCGRGGLTQLFPGETQRVPTWCAYVDRLDEEQQYSLESTPEEDVRRGYRLIPEFRYWPAAIPQWIFVMVQNLSPFPLAIDLGQRIGRIYPVSSVEEAVQGSTVPIPYYQQIIDVSHPKGDVVVAPGGHVSPEMEQVSSPGSASSTLLEEHHGDEDDEYDEDDATEETEIQSCDHEEVPIETVVPPNRPSTSTYDAIVASEGKIVDAENRRHSDMMTVLERMIGLQEETVSQLAHLHRVFIEVPKQLQKINTSFEALVVQQTQANYWRMTNVPQFNTSQPGSVHAGQFSPHSSDIHSPGPNVTGQVADIAVQVPDDILPLPSVQIQQQTPTKEATKTKQDTHETDQPSLVQCLPTCSHVSLGTSPVREQSLPKSPVGESLPKSPVGESLPKSPVVFCTEPADRKRRSELQGLEQIKGEGVRTPESQLVIIHHRLQL
ncbi:uncharacterized protein LOC142463893 [Ascaphus truei]|uniref:uncharacterized protein LOC142463893 n=1 Tax=Ascaphus truei TaxID=8439 RepID=UPI003F59C3A5